MKQLLTVALLLVAASVQAQREIPNRYLTNLTVKGEVIIGTLTNADLNTLRYADRLSNTLVSSGFTVTNSTYSCEPFKADMPQLQVPVVISESATDRTKKRAERLMEAFWVEKYKTRVLYVERGEFPCGSLGTNQVMIFVTGAKLLIRQP